MLQTTIKLKVFRKIHPAVFIKPTDNYANTVRMFSESRAFLDHAICRSHFS